MNHLRSYSPPEVQQTLMRTIRMMFLAVMMGSTARASSNFEIVGVIPGRVIDILGGEISGSEISKEFEGFTPRMKTDSQSGTLVIGHGTDVGERLEEWPYASYGLDVAEKLRSLGMDNQSIKSLMHGKTTISEDTAIELFEMRYERRKEIIEKKYSELSEKNFSDLPEVIRKMLVDFSYNMRGEHGIFPHEDRTGFPNACAALLRGDWITMANEIADSNYAREVGARRAGYWIHTLFILYEKEIQIPMKKETLSSEGQKLVIEYLTRYQKDVEGSGYAATPLRYINGKS